MNKIIENGIETVTYESSAVKSSQYDPAIRMLIVTFNSGTSYQFAGVSQEDYDAFSTCESTGNGFNKYIKKYIGDKI
jgi:hypothetical protein